MATTTILATFLGRRLIARECITQSAKLWRARFQAYKFPFSHSSIHSTPEVYQNCLDLNECPVSRSSFPHCVMPEVRRASSCRCDLFPKPLARLMRLHVALSTPRQHQGQRLSGKPHHPSTIYIATRPFASHLEPVVIFWRPLEAVRERPPRVRYHRRYETPSQPRPRLPATSRLCSHHLTSWRLISFTSWGIFRIRFPSWR